MEADAIVCGWSRSRSNHSQPSWLEPKNVPRGPAGNKSGEGITARSRRVSLSIIISLPLGPGRNDFGPAVVRVRTAKSAVAGDHLLHAHFPGWQTAIVRKDTAALISARAPRHLSG